MGQWFNTSGFVTDPTQVATIGQARVFPNYLSGYGGCRANSMKNFNVSLARDFRLRERASLQMSSRIHVYNLANRGLFGTVTSQVSAQAQRAFTFQARVSF